MHKTSSGAANGEMALVKTVARLTPWFAPFPSAFFVARSSMKHLQIPLVVAIVIAAIIEFLGLTSVHTWLWLSDWNNRKRKSDPAAPAGYALALGLVYLVTTIGLTILLEVFPALSTYAPALFPALALVGAFNLALISQQKNREALVRQEREERRAERSGWRSSERTGWRSEPVQVNVQEVLTDWTGAERQGIRLNSNNPARKTNRDEALNDLVAFYAQNPGASYSIAGQAVNRSKAWVSDAVAKLEQVGRLRRNGHGIEIINED
jgi:hypothetical protein